MWRAHVQARARRGESSRGRGESASFRSLLARTNDQVKLSLNICATTTASSRPVRHARHGKLLRPRAPAVRHQRASGKLQAPHATVTDTRSTHNAPRGHCLLEVIATTMKIFLVLTTTLAYVAGQHMDGPRADHDGPNSRCAALCDPRVYGCVPLLYPPRSLLRMSDSGAPRIPGNAAV